MKVYISGKIGEDVISEETRQKFARAEAMLKAKGYEVFNPCDERWQKILKREYEGDKYVKSPWLACTFPDFYTYCLLRDLMVLSTKDAILMLEDWDQSSGALTEFDFAKAGKKIIFFARREHAVLYLQEEWRKNSKVMSMRCPQYKYVDLHLGRLWLPIAGKEAGL